MAVISFYFSSPQNGQNLDEMSLILGIPLGSSVSPSNYSSQIRDISEAAVLLWGNFIRNGSVNNNWVWIFNLQNFNYTPTEFEKCSFFHFVAERLFGIWETINFLALFIYFSVILIVGSDKSLGFGSTISPIEFPNGLHSKMWVEHTWVLVSYFSI